MRASTPPPLPAQNLFSRALIVAPVFEHTYSDRILSGCSTMPRELLSQRARCARAPPSLGH